MRKFNIVLMVIMSLGLIGCFHDKDVKDPEFDAQVSIVSVSSSLMEEDDKQLNSIWVEVKNNGRDDMIHGYVVGLGYKIDGYDHFVRRDIVGQDLEVGHTHTYMYQFESFTSDTCEIRVWAQFVTSGNDTNPDNNSDTFTLEGAVAPAITYDAEVLFTVDNNYINVGDPVKITVKITNNGPDAIDETARFLLESVRDAEESQIIFDTNESISIPVGEWLETEFEFTGEEASYFITATVTFSDDTTPDNNSDFDMVIFGPPMTLVGDG